MSTSPHLKRDIGLLFLVLYGVGDILGAGIYGLVGKAAGQMGNAVWLSFLASMVAAGLTGLSYASLGSRFPKAGGASFITHEAFGSSFLAYIIGLGVLASGLTSMATASRVFAGYFVSRFPLVGLEITIIIFALLVATVIFRGIKETMWMNALCTVTEVGGLLFIVFVGLPFLGVGANGENYLSATAPQNPDGAITLSLLLSGAVLTFYSFIGFEDILNVSEEVRNPKRTIPLALLLAVGISSLIYMLISLIAVSVLTPTSLLESKQPLVDVAAAAAPWFSSSAFGIISMFAVANTFLLNFTMGSRLFYGMAKQGLLPKYLGRLHAGRQTPHYAIVTILIILFALAFGSDVSVLARSTSVMLLTCFIVVNGALIMMKRRGTDWEGAFEVPIFVPTGGILVSLAMLSQAQWPELRVALILLSIIGALYFVLKPTSQSVREL